LVCLEKVLACSQRCYRHGDALMPRRSKNETRAKPATIPPLEPLVALEF
jgi:hypothetical protein